MKKAKNRSPLFENSEQENKTIQIEKIEPKRNYFIIYDTIYRNNELSATEKGLLLNILTIAPTFKPTRNGLMKISKLKRNNYDNAIKNLQRKGYLKIERINNKEYKYIVNQAPILRTLNKDLSYDALAPLLDIHYYNELYKMGYIEEDLFNELNKHFYEIIKLNAYK